MCGEGLSLREVADKLQGAVATAKCGIATDAFGEIVQNPELGRSLSYGRLSWFLSLPAGVLDAWLDQHGSDGAYAVASHIPAPYIHEADDQPKSHSLTELLLRKYANENRVFQHYIGQSYCLKSYQSDIASLKDNEAEVAQRLRSHLLKQVRDWAAFELKGDTRGAK